MRNSHSFLTTLFLLLFATVMQAEEPSTADAPKTLTVGDKAPPLSIAHWLHDNHGKLKPVETYEAGKVYIIEFWGTWCPPCIAMMPHLAQLQEKYGYSTLRIIGVSTEDLNIIQQFFERDVPGTDGLKYGALTQRYSLTSDPDRSVYEDYLTASGVLGIPAAFIVGKSGLIEWIGNPGTICEPLIAVMDDKWNLDAFKVEFQRRQSVLSAVRKISILRQMNRNEPEIVLAEIDKEIKKLEGTTIPKVQILRTFRIQMLVKLGRFDDVEEEVDSALETCGDDLEAAGLAASNILQLPQSEQIDVKRLVAIAVDRIEVAKRSTLLNKWHPSMRTLAEAKTSSLVAQLYARAGQIQDAMMAAEKSVEAAPDAETKRAAQALHERFSKMLQQRNDRGESVNQQ